MIKLQSLFSADAVNKTCMLVV